MCPTPRWNRLRRINGANGYWSHWLNTAQSWRWGGGGNVSSSRGESSERWSGLRLGSGNSTLTKVVGVRVWEDDYRYREEMTSSGAVICSIARRLRQSKRGMLCTSTRAIFILLLNVSSCDRLPRAVVANEKYVLHLVSEKRFTQTLRLA